jgi:Rhodopirellula transposase DDE domain
VQLATVRAKEHRLSSHIAMNWRGTPLVNLATIVSLIGSTHSRSGLRVRSELDRGRYPGGVTLTDTQMATIQLQRHREAALMFPKCFLSSSSPCAIEHLAVLR